MHLVQSVRHVAGHESQRNTNKCPSLALKIGHRLAKISMLVESLAHIQENCTTAKDAGTVHSADYTKPDGMK